MFLTILGIGITAFMYMIYPLYKFTNKEENYTKKEIRKTLIINSIVVFIIDILIAYSIYQDTKYANIFPAFLYFFINASIWYRKANNDITLNNDTNIKDVAEEQDKHSESENKKSVLSEYNNLKKLKELLDDDIITKEEFNAEKEKILKK